MTVPSAPGLKALAVKVDPAQRRVRLAVGGVESDVAIDLPSSELGSGDATAEAVAIGDGKTVVHVRVPSRLRSDVAWEAIFAGRDAGTLWAAVTGYTKGEAGERTGASLELSPPDESGERVVVAGELREDLRLCGQTRTLLAPRVLDPESLAFRSATMQRLPEDQRDKAERVVASPHGGPADPPLARLLLATGASTAIGNPAAVTDGDRLTTWSEARPTDGHGEFVVMRAAGAVPIARLAISLAPPAPPPPSPQGAAPRSFFLLTDDRTLAVTIPEDPWLHPGAAYEIPLADPIKTSCLALVLDKAYVRAGEAHPNVTVAELTAYSAFDRPGATLDPVAKALAGGGPRAEAAKEILERAGDAGLAAALAAFASLDAPGRALAIDAAIGAGTCEASAPLLLTAIDDADGEVARKGREKIERCGKRAVAALLAALHAPDSKLRATAATLVASVAPAEALEPLVSALGHEGATATERSALRSGIAKAARAASGDKLAALVGGGRSAEAEVDLLRALEERLPAIATPSDAAIAALEGGTPPMRTRFLLIGPVAALARGGDAAEATRLAEVIAKDGDAAVRAHAAEAAAGVPAATAVLAQAVEKDPAPRVREAALEAFASARPDGRAPADALVGSVAHALSSDEWTFVRAAAAAALASFPAGPRVDEALEAAVADSSPGVREAVVTALGGHGDVRAAKQVRERLADDHETLEVRLAAARTLASLCDRASLDLLTTLASRAPLPMASDEDIAIGFEAAQALGHLHPPDLATRLAPLAAKDARVEARTAAARALATAPTCR